jgi:hypothetical protein
MESHRCARFAFPLTPLPYLRERYELGCELPEEAIKMHSRRKGWGFEVLWHIYKPVLRPTSTYDITLTHCCRALELFRLSGVSQTSLRRDPKPLKAAFSADLRISQKAPVHPTVGYVKKS